MVNKQLNNFPVVKYVKKYGSGHIQEPKCLLERFPLFANFSHTYTAIQRTKQSLLIQNLKQKCYEAITLGLNAALNKERTQIQLFTDHVHVHWQMPMCPCLQYCLCLQTPRRIAENQTAELTVSTLPLTACLPWQQITNTTRYNDLKSLVSSHA